MSFADKSIQRIPFPRTSTTPCIHSLQLSVFAFCTLHPFLPCTGRRCMGNSLACRMFSCSCTVWVSLPPPRSPRSLQFFRIDRNLPSLSPRLNEHSPRTCDPHHLFPFIFTCLTYHSPPRPPHLLPPIPSNIESTP